MLTIGRGNGRWVGGRQKHPPPPISATHHTSAIPTMKKLSTVIPYLKKIKKKQKKTDVTHLLSSANINIF